MIKKTAASLVALLVANAPLPMEARAKGSEIAVHLTPAAAVAGHCAAWNTTNRAKRDALLKRVFATDGIYADPTPTYVVGRVALSAEIAGFHRQYPGARFRCSAPQAHHNAMRVSWLLTERDGKITRGMDFYELGKDGLIRRVTGFFGPPPALKP